MKRQLNTSELFTKANKLAADLIRHDKTFATRRLTRSHALSTAFKRIRGMYDVVSQLDTKELVWREKERQENERPEWDRVQEFYTRPAWNQGAYTVD
jgi:hypothetical protein